MAEAMVLHMAPSKIAAPSWTYLFYDIGLDRNASIFMDIHCQTRATNAYLIMLTDAQFKNWEGSRPFLPEPGHKLNSYLVSYWRQNLDSGIRTTHRIRTPHAERYHMGILNVGPEELTVRAEIRFTNPYDQHLPLQYEHVPASLGFVASAFLVSSATLLVLFITVWRRKRTAIHSLILAAQLLKFISLVLECQDFNIISRTGHTSVLRAATYGLLQKLHATLDVLLLLVASLGWKIHRSRLSLIEVRFLAGISTILLYLGTLEVFCGMSSSCDSYLLGRYVSQALCYLVIIFALHFNCQVVHTRLADAFVSPLVEDLYEKRQTYYILWTAFVVWILQPSVLLLIQVYLLDWRQVWLYMLLRGLSSWVVCLIVAFALCPRPPVVPVLSVVLGPSDLRHRNGLLDVDSVDSRSDRGDIDTETASEPISEYASMVSDTDTTSLE